MADSLDVMMAQTQQKEAEAVQPLAPKMYVDSRQESQPAPLIYKPNGSFKSLVKQNKMLPSDQASMDVINNRKAREDRKHFIPGTTLYTRGKQHVAGRTFGEATNKSFETNYRDLAQESVIPSNPEENREVKHTMPPGSFITHHFGNKPYHIPGYTGHVTGIKDEYGITYGNLTNSQMKQWKADHPERSGRQAEGQAQTIKDPHVYVLNSNPLPGGVLRSDPPRKLVPGKTKMLQYY